eukprot:762890-Pleurochrysis_carterae.AAC.8
MFNMLGPHIDSDGKDGFDADRDSDGGSLMERDTTDYGDGESDGNGDSDDDDDGAGDALANPDAGTDASDLEAKMQRKTSTDLRVVLFRLHKANNFATAKKGGSNMERRGWNAG